MYTKGVVANDVGDTYWETIQRERDQFCLGRRETRRVFSGVEVAVYLSVGTGTVDLVMVGPTMRPVIILGLVILLEDLPAVVILKTVKFC
jgi:hypothetical protein